MKRILFTLTALTMVLSACGGKGDQKGSIKKVVNPARTGADQKPAGEAPKPARYMIGTAEVKEAQLVEAINNSFKNSGKAALELQNVNITIIKRTKGGEWSPSGTSAAFVVRNEICSKADLDKKEARPLNFQLAYSHEQDGGNEMIKAAAAVVPFWIPATESSSTATFTELPATAFAANQSLTNYESRMLRATSTASNGSAALMNVLENNPDYGIDKADVYFRLSHQITSSTPKLEFSIYIDRGNDTYLVIDLSYIPTNETVEEGPRGC